jgi:predicted amidophosphoribosyltransferase
MRLRSELGAVKLAEILERALERREWNPSEALYKCVTRRLVYTCTHHSRLTREQQLLG